MPDVEAWPLPDEPYVPGRTPRPETGPVFAISGAAPEATDPDLWFQHEAWLSGFRLYRHGYFWETHEVWEPVWIGARPNSAERAMVQGLIQVASRMGLDLAAARAATAGFLSRLASVPGAEALDGRPPYDQMIDYRGENVHYNA